MRIGIDARALLEPHPSGVSYYCQQLLAALLADPKRTDTICLFTSGLHVPTERLAPLRQYPLVEHRHLAWPNKLYNSLSLLRLAPAMDRYLGGVNVMFLPNWNFFPHQQSVPYVLTVHDCAPQLYPHFFTWKQRWWHRLIQPERLVQHAKRVIAVSEQTKRDCVSQFHLNPTAITTIYSGAGIAQPSVIVPNLPDQFVVMIGTLEARKNIQAVVAAMEQVWQTQPQVQLVCLGEQRQAITLMKRDQRIQVLGYLSDAEKSYVLSRAQVLVYPSIYEGFGFPPLEAFQAGVPVLTSFAGAAPEVCGQAACYVNPYSATDIATAITTLLTNETLRQQYIAAGKKQLTQFDWQKTAQATLQVLHEAVY